MLKTKEVAQDTNPKCPSCKSKNILTNKSGERFCRRCGHEWKTKKS